MRRPRNWPTRRRRRSHEEGGVDPWVTPPRAEGVTVKNGTGNGHWGFWKRMCTELVDGLVAIFGA